MSRLMVRSLSQGLSGWEAVRIWLQLWETQFWIFRCVLTWPQSAAAHGPSPEERWSSEDVRTPEPGRRPAARWRALQDSCWLTPWTSAVMWFWSFFVDYLVLHAPRLSELYEQPSLPSRRGPLSLHWWTRSQRRTGDIKPYSLKLQKVGTMKTMKEKSVTFVSHFIWLVFIYLLLFYFYFCILGKQHIKMNE